MATMPVYAFGAVIATVSALLAFSAQAAKIVCWTDEHGRRACGDRVPPQYARQERQIYDASGRIVETRPRQKTPEELAADQARTEQVEMRRKRAEEQAAYDRFLTTTFSSVTELERTRDTRLRTVDSRLSLAEESLEENEKGIAQIKAQIAEMEAEGRKVPGKLARELKEFEDTLDGNRHAAAKLRDERVEIANRFAQDITRYRALTGRPEVSRDETPPGSMATEDAGKIEE